jgi:hypothetical protein
VLDCTREDVGDGLNAAVRVPGKSLDVIGGIVVAEVVEEQEWIELRGLAEAEGAFELTPAPSSVGLVWMISFTGRSDISNSFFQPVLKIRCADAASVSMAGWA